MTGTLKKNKKKWIYIGVGLVIFALTAAGVGFWLWNRSKNSNNSDFADKEGDKEMLEKIEQWRKEDWTDKESGYSLYAIPPFLTNVSVKRAKEEVIEAIWQWSGQGKDKRKIEKTLEKNARRINLADKKKYDNKEKGVFGIPKFLESLSNKYQQDIFFNRPDQKKFESGISENSSDIFLLLHSFNLEYKSNKEIDWQASFQKLKENKPNEKKTKAQQEQEFQEIVNYIKREVNLAIIEHTKKFPHLDSLIQLNNWVNILNRKKRVGKSLIYSLWWRAKELGKKIPPPNKIKVLVQNLKMKNEKFDLQFQPVIFDVREEK